mgnify:CR=1 FL=1|jgi:NLR family CARD domain-containing protein 3
MPIGDEGATTVADLLRDNKSVTKLTLNTCNIRAPGATALAETLRANTHLLTFDYTGNSIGVEGTREIREAWNGTRHAASDHTVSSGGKWHIHGESQS